MKQFIAEKDLNYLASVDTVIIDSDIKGELYVNGRKESVLFLPKTEYSYIKEGKYYILKPTRSSDPGEYHVDEKEFSKINSINSTSAKMKKFKIYYSPDPFPKHEKPETYYLGEVFADCYDLFVKNLISRIRDIKGPNRPSIMSMQGLKKFIDIMDTEWGVSYGLDYMKQREDKIFK